MERLHEQIEEVECSVATSKAEKEVRWACSQAELRQHEETETTKKNILNNTERSVDCLKDK